MRGAAVLIVDDDRDARDGLAAIIERAGYSVATASDGREALAVMRAAPPELIFLDICMPGVDGAQFRQAQRRNRAWLQVPTVVMTGSSEEPQLDLAVVETLHKPVKPSALLALVARHCTRRR